MPRGLVATSGSEHGRRDPARCEPDWNRNCARVSNSVARQRKGNVQAIRPSSSPASQNRSIVTIATRFSIPSGLSLQTTATAQRIGSGNDIRTTGSWNRGSFTGRVVSNILEGCCGSRLASIQRTRSGTSGRTSSGKTKEFSISSSPGSLSSSGKRIPGSVWIAKISWTPAWNSRNAAV